MVRLARAEVFDPSEVAILHLCARVVRRCFLFGLDPVSGKNHGHRKIWIEDQLKLLAANFGIDLLSMAILSNHFHLILRSRPDVVETWDDTEVARRWLMLCPKRKKKDRSPEEPNDSELNSIRNDPEKLATIRTRLRQWSSGFDSMDRHDKVHRLTLTPDESTIVGYSGQSTIRFWDCKTRSALFSQTIPRGGAEWLNFADSNTLHVHATDGWYVLFGKPNLRKPVAE